jgi:hypothetical protein
MQEREPRGLHHTENDAGDFAPKQAIKPHPNRKQASGPTSGLLHGFEEQLGLGLGEEYPKIPDGPVEPRKPKRPPFIMGQTDKD